ncbi:MAG: hypothetical protein ACRYGA_06000 [Janthinobacterium lividum]
MTGEAVTLVAVDAVETAVEHQAAAHVEQQWVAGRDFDPPVGVEALR